MYKTIKANDLINIGLPKSALCKHCCFQVCGNKVSNENPCTDYCYRFTANNMPNFINSVAEHIEHTSTIRKERLMKRVTPLVSQNTTKKDSIYTLDHYYVSMINDTIQEIRKGKTAYIYSIKQLQDVMSYERNFTINYDAESGAIVLTGLKKH